MSRGYLGDMYENDSAQMLHDDVSYASTGVTLHLVSMRISLVKAHLMEFRE